ncbi:MAG TPA: glycosyltransferase family 1 protein [Acidimicrobiia bacterium]
MNVVMDARMAFHTGIGRYIRSLCRTLIQQAATVRLSLLVDPRTADRLQRELGAVAMIPFQANIYSVNAQIHSLWRYRGWSKHETLIHIPHYDVPWFLPSRSVVTIHDLTHFQFPAATGQLRHQLAWRLLQRAVHRAGHLIVVSQATRDALTTFVPQASRKTTVIYHGIDAHFTPLPPDAITAFKRAQHLGRFFLYVGADKPHKNLPRLLQAFVEVRAQWQEPLELVLLGVAPARSWPPPEGVRMYHEVTDAQLVAWYNAAEALLLPSLNEGFGLPALEAMACGTPVIAFGRGSMPEIIVDGVGGYIVDDIDQAMAALEPVSGLDRVAVRGSVETRFDVGRMVEEYLAVYEQVLNSR